MKKLNNVVFSMESKESKKISTGVERAFIKPLLLAIRFCFIIGIFITVTQCDLLTGSDDPNPSNPSDPSDPGDPSNPGGSACSSDTDGDGLIEISNASELNNIRYDLAGLRYKTSADDETGTSGCKGYEITRNISFNALSGWVPVGTTEEPFTAILEGNGYTINNLYLAPVPDSETQSMGLFGAVSGTVRNLVFSRADGLTVTAVETVGNDVITAGYTLGIVAGELLANGVLDNVKIIPGSNLTADPATVTGKGIAGSIGGLVGIIRKDAVVMNSIVYVTVSSEATIDAGTDAKNIGALAGLNEGSIINSITNGSVTATADTATGTAVTDGGAKDIIGGLVGSNSGMISGSTANVAVASNEGADDHVGGLVGDNTGIITTSNVTGAVSAGDGANNYVGGLVGNNNGGEISQNRATGAVTVGAGDDVYVGGLIGNNIAVPISDSSAFGAVTVGDGANAYAGGLVGNNAMSSISNSSAFGAVAVGDGEGVYAGGLIGDNATSPISNSSATGAVGAGTGINVYVGGLVGSNDDSDVSDSYAHGSVVAGDGEGDHVGGLVGHNNDSDVSNSYASGTVQSGDGNNGRVGGLIGFNDQDSNITDSNASGNVTNSDGATTHVGGLVGANESNTAGSKIISGCHAIGIVSVGPGSGTRGGGLVGVNNGNVIINSYANGNVNGGADSNHVGGLVGHNLGGIIRTSHASGSVSSGGGTDTAGGLIGRSDNGIVLENYATGDVSSGGDGDSAGGLIGEISGENSIVSNNYATGKVTDNQGTLGTDYLGAFVGLMPKNIGLSNNYAVGNVERNSGNSASLGAFVGYIDDAFNSTSTVVAPDAISASYAVGNVNLYNTSGNYGGNFVGQDESADDAYCDDSNYDKMNKCTDNGANWVLNPFIFSDVYRIGVININVISDVTENDEGVEKTLAELKVLTLGAEDASTNPKGAGASWTSNNWAGMGTTPTDKILYPTLRLFLDNNDDGDNEDPGEVGDILCGQDDIMEESSGDFCSDGTFTTESTCLSTKETWVAGTCSDGTSMTEATCLSEVGVWTDSSCDNVSSFNKEDCEVTPVNTWTFGVCVFNGVIDSTVTNETACEAKSFMWQLGTCNDTEYGNEMDCLTMTRSWIPRNCSDGVSGSSITCVSNGGTWTEDSCIYDSDSKAASYTTEEACTQAGEWTAASSGYCYNSSSGEAENGHTDETDCLSTLGSWTDESCNNSNVSYDNREECRTNSVNVWTEGSCSDGVSTNEAYCTSSSVNSWGKCSDTNHHGNKEACLAVRGTWTVDAADPEIGSCSNNELYTNQADCEANAINIWGDRLSNLSCP